MSPCGALHARYGRIEKISNRICSKIEAMARACSLLLLLVALGGPPAQAADAIYPPGSRLGLVPPSGMITSTNFFGFEDPNTNATITLVSLPAQAYGELERSVSAEVLKREGVALEKRETLSLPAGKAFLVIGHEDKTRSRKWILIGAASNLTALVTMQIPDGAKNLYSDASIRETLATLTVRDTVPVDEQLSLLPFKITDLAGYRVGAIVPGRAVILSDAPLDAPSPAPSQMLVTVAPGGPTQTSEREAFARDVFAAVPNVRDVRIITSEPLRIQGQPGHQILAQARDATGAKSLTVVQWLRFGGGGYLQLVAIAPVEAWPDAYPRFRAVRDGIEPR